MRPVTFLSVVAMALSAAAPTSAQGSADDKAAAEALFDKARALTKAGSFAQACPLYVESQRLDPAVGTLLYLADCYEQTGKTASAWATFREAMSSARATQPDRAKMAESRAAALEPKLSKLSVTLAPGGDVPGLVVKRDGTVVSPTVFGTGVPVDPGPRVITADAPDREPWTETVTVAGPGERTVVVPVLRPRAAATPVTSPAAKQSSSPNPSPPPPTTEPRRASPTAAYVSLGVGGAGVLVGSYFGLRAFSKWSAAKDNCAGVVACKPEGISDGESAKKAATVSTVAFAVGAVGLAAGVTLLVLGKPSQETSAKVLVGPAGVAVKGAF